MRLSNYQSHPAECLSKYSILYTFSVFTSFEENKWGKTLTDHFKISLNNFLEMEIGILRFKWINEAMNCSDSALDQELAISVSSQFHSWALSNVKLIPPLWRPLAVCYTKFFHLLSIVTNQVWLQVFPVFIWIWPITFSNQSQWPTVLVCWG